VVQPPPPPPPVGGGGGGGGGSVERRIFSGGLRGPVLKPGDSRTV
jgi:hypothetical protein